MLKLSGWEQIWGNDHVGCGDSTEETGVRGSKTRNTPRGSMVCLGNEVPVLSDTQGVGPPPHTHTHQTLPPQALEGDSHQSKRAPVCCNCLRLSAATDALCIPQCGHRTPPWPEWASVSQSATSFTPSRLGREQMPEGGTHTEVGLKPKLSPRGSATREEEWKSLCAAAHAVD